ncbi:MAG TPA: CBS domain-containing protein [candidate division Zixibacteria bacterium]|nr:CBS domain-containing protein [candidate division Zixibacteria bacterium]
MLVGKRMTKNPVTVAPEDLLVQARLKMQKGGFRRLPVVVGDRLVGIITDRDIREHVGYLDRTPVKVAMTEKPITVTPATTVEAATHRLLKRKIGGLPVVENGRLVGIITTSDILQAFLEVSGAAEEGTARIDFVMEGAEHGFAQAVRTVTELGGEVLGMGTFRGKWGESTVCYLRLRTGDPESIAQALKGKGFEVLGIQPVAE